MSLLFVIPTFRKWGGVNEAVVARAEQFQSATRRAFYDCSRAEQLLGRRPAVGIQEGVQRSFASLRAAGAGQPA